jgi:hypothetical protein
MGQNIFLLLLQKVIAVCKTVLKVTSECMTNAATNNMLLHYKYNDTINCSETSAQCSHKFHIPAICIHLFWSQKNAHIIISDAVFLTYNIPRMTVLDKTTVKVT